MAQADRGSHALTLNAISSGMNAERDIFDRLDQSDADALADAEADADAAAGRVVDNAEVVKWLAKWGTPEETPAPPEWLE